MAIPSAFKIGVSGMMASKAAVATTGHNIANANSEGYSRQRVETITQKPEQTGNKAYIGRGVLIGRVDRFNDEYVEKQIRNTQRELSHLEEKDSILKQVEDVFNEMNGEGLNRLMSRFFNAFRALSNEPENQALRQAVRESTQAVATDFQRLRQEAMDINRHIDARIENYCREITDIAHQVKDTNFKINQMELSDAPANDLQDKRDVLLKKLASFMDLQMHKDNFGNFVVEIRGVGPLVVGPEVQSFKTARTGADDQGKIENALDVFSTSSALTKVTHQIKGGKLGALLETRDNTLTNILNRLDELAFTVTNSVNEIHRQGFTRDGFQGVDFFKPLATQDRAAEFIGLSDEVAGNVNNIATAAIVDAPGDNRISTAISGLQSMRLMNNGKATMDEWFNSIVADVGVVAQRSRAGINQQKDIMTNLNKTREQISGVSIDEETANLMQFHQTYDASSKIIQVADEMLKTVLELKR